MDYTVSRGNGRTQIQLNGEFTVLDSGKFWEIKKTLEKDLPQACEVDISKLKFIDSTGLGMLAILDDLAKTSDFSLTFSKPSGQVAEMFSIAAFHQIILIEA